MTRSHTMTPKRRMALKKAQAASARKRRGKGKGKLAAAHRQLGPRSSNSSNRGRNIRRGLKVAGAAAAVGLVAYKAHGLAGDYKKMKSHQIRTEARIRVGAKKEVRRIQAAAEELKRGNRRRAKQHVARIKQRTAAKGSSGTRTIVGYSNAKAAPASRPSTHTPVADTWSSIAPGVRRRILKANRMRAIHEDAKGLKVAPRYVQGRRRRKKK